MHFLRLFHLYTGLFLSLALFLIAVSGGLLLYKDEFRQLRMAELREPHAVTSFEDQALAIHTAHEQFGDRLESIKMPVSGVPAYHLYLTDGEALMAADDLQVIDQWSLRQRLMGFLFDLHAHLLAGHTGELVAGFIGLAGGAMALTGLVLWWPTRRNFSLRHLWIRDGSRRSLLAWHREAGLLMSPLLLLLILSGSAMVFYTQVQTALNAAFGDEVPGVALPSLSASVLNAQISLPDATLLARVGGHLPNTQLLYYYFDASRTGYHRFRLRGACELHPNGRSFIHAAPHSGELFVQDGCAMPPGERITNMIYPLHAGKTGSEIYRLLAFLTAAVLAGLAASGVVTYLQKLRRTRRSRQTLLARA